MNHWVPARTIWQLIDDFLEAIFKDSWFADHPIAKNCVCRCLFFLKCLGPNAINHWFTILASCPPWSYYRLQKCVVSSCHTWQQHTSSSLYLIRTAFDDGYVFLTRFLSSPKLHQQNSTCKGNTTRSKFHLLYLQQHHMLWVWLLPILEEGTSRRKKKLTIPNPLYSVASTTNFKLLNVAMLKCQKHQPMLWILESHCKKNRTTLSFSKTSSNLSTIYPFIFLSSDPKTASITRMETRCIVSSLTCNSQEFLPGEYHVHI
jgi:hypothetical protein